MSSDELLSSVEKRFLDELLQNYNLLACEAKKKHPHVKEACETGIIRVRNASSSRMLTAMGLKNALLAESPQLLEPFFMGCDTKMQKMVQISINAIQKLIIFECLNTMASSNLLNSLWNLMEHGIEEVKILQTVTLLLTTNQLVVNDQLARTISLCFRLHYTKNPTTKNTASATIRQMVTAIFERLQMEDKIEEKESNQENISEGQDGNKLSNKESNEKTNSRKMLPKKLRPAAFDAFNFIQDLIQIINGEELFWMSDVTEITKTFGLELLELIFDQFPNVFHKHQEFTFILKEKICQLVIKFFSPNIKQRGQFSLNPYFKPQNSSSNATSSASGAGSSAMTVNTNLAQSVQMSTLETPFWPITVRLMRLVSVMIKNFFEILVTECEIFLSLLVKSLEVDKFNWQRSIALEALYKMIEPNLIASLCKYYDMKPQSSKILKDIVNALCIYIQSQFQVIDSSTTQSLITSLVNNTNSGSTAPSFINNSSGSSLNRNNQPTVNSPFPMFNLRGISISLLFIPFHKVHRYKTFYIDQLEKPEPPNSPEGHGLSTALACVFELVSSMTKIIEKDLNTSFDSKSDSTENSSVKQITLDNISAEIIELHRNMLQSTFCGLIGTFSLLLDASVDEVVTELILEQMRKLSTMYGLYQIDVARDALLVSMCKSSLPSNYYSIAALNPYNLQFDESVLPKANSDALSNTNPINFNTLNASITNAAINLPNLLSQQNSCQNTAGSGGSNGAGGNTVGANLSSIDNNGSSGGVDVGRQIIAVGTPLPTVGQPNTGTTQQQQQQGPVMLTSKNLQCMNALLNISIRYGYVFEENSWHIVFTTLQHLVWILGLKPNQSGVYRLGQQHQTKNSPSAPLTPTSVDTSSTGANNPTSLGTTTSSSNSVITNAAMSDLPVLTTMLSRLFECTHYVTISERLSLIFFNSQYLNDECLMKLVKALIELSNESLEVAYNNREPSLFAVVKLLEMGLVNLKRIGLMWNMITSHLIEVSSHPYNKLREWGVDVLCNLVKSALTHVDQSSLLEEKTESDRDHPESLQSQSYYLNALKALSDIKFVDIRQKQIECSLQLLQSNGENLTDGWLILFAIIESACAPQNENLIRCSFQCYQFIVSDLLNHIPSMYLIHCINVAVAFGSQLQELNVSLTAIGLIWNVADFLHTNQAKIQESLTDGHKFENVDLPFCDNLAPFQSLWISLFKNLSNLCTDARLSIRKSSGQTLFSTLSTHGSILDYNTWKAIFFYVLFPLIDSVRTLCSMASNERITYSESSINKPQSYGDNSEYIIHYSRNTAFKQWCETQVLVLNGISRILCLKLELFVHHIINDVKVDSSNTNEIVIDSSNTKTKSEILVDNESLLLNVWSLFFEFIYTSSVCANVEVSTSAMKCFNETVIFLNEHHKMVKSTNTEKVSTDPAKVVNVLSPIWKVVWKTWCNIGHHIGISKIVSECQPTNGLNSNRNGVVNAVAVGETLPGPSQVLISSQAFLCLLIKPMFYIFPKILKNFSDSDFKNLSYVLQNAISTPFINEPSVYNYIQSEQSLTQLQTEVITLLEKIQEQISSNSNSFQHLLPLLFYQYLAFSLYAVNIIPPHMNIFISSQFQHRFLPGELTTFNTTSYFIFGERALKNAFHLYQITYKEQVVIKSHILHSLIKAYKVPLCFKYSCPLQSTWKYTVNYFIKTLELGLPLARKFPSDFISIWADLALTFEGFLFPVNKPPTNQSLEEQQMDESLDVKVVEVIRDNIMVYAQQIPKEFLLQIVSILNRGSIHSPSITSPIEIEINRKLREDFARVCFQTLLQFSFFGPKGNPDLFIQTKNNLSEKSPSPEHNIGIVNKLAVASILKRFNDVIVRYVEDEKLCPCPLPRHRLSEISFVLKALATLILSLKEAPQGSVETHVWQQLIDLYPRIVDCTMSNSPQVNQSIREVLHEYAYLLSCPQLSSGGTLTASKVQASTVETTNSNDHNSSVAIPKDIPNGNMSTAQQSNSNNKIKTKTMPAKTPFQNGTTEINI